MRTLLLGEQEVERFLARERSARVTRWVWMGLIVLALGVGLVLEAFSRGG